jgi:predicted nucleic acid-binding Zn ribbon protein
MQPISKNRYYNRRRDPQAVKGILQAVLGKYGLDKKLEQYEFVLHWREIVGEDIAKRAVPESVQGTTLVVKVESAAWAQELSFQKKVILKRYQAAMKSDGSDKRKLFIKDIRFYVGK